MVFELKAGGGSNSCSIALVKTLTVFWICEEKERNTEFMVVIILL